MFWPYQLGSIVFSVKEPIHLNTPKNLTTCRKSANKPSSCVQTDCYKLSTSLEQQGCSDKVHTVMIFIIYIPSARGIRRNIGPKWQGQRSCDKTDVY